MELPNNIIKGTGIYKKEQKLLEPNDDEQWANHYEYILENENFGKTSGSMEGCGVQSGMFRRQSNPLYIDLYNEQSSPTGTGKRAHSPILLTICILMFVSSLVSLAMGIVALFMIFGKTISSPVENIQELLQDHEVQLTKLIQNELTQLDVWRSHFEEKISKISNQSSHMRGFNVTQCLYRSIESGNSATTSSTVTGLVPPLENLKNLVVTGVTCSVDGGLTALLIRRGEQYQCNCTGQASSDVRYCRVHYWFCLTSS